MLVSQTKTRPVVVISQTCLAVLKKSSTFYLEWKLILLLWLKKFWLKQLETYNAKRVKHIILKSLCDTLD